MKKNIRPIRPGIFIPALLTLLLCDGICNGQKLSVQPSILEFHLTPGMSASQAVHITNLGDKKMGFRAYLADWVRDSTGAHHYFRPDTLSASCAGWIQLEKNFIEIGPGKSEEFVVKLQGPRDPAAYRQMKWAMLFLRTGEEQDSAACSGKEVSTQIKQLLQIGVHVYQTPPSVNRRSAKILSLTEVANDGKAYDLHMENTGETMLQCKAHLELTSIETGKEQKTERTEFPVFPGAKRIVRLSLPEGMSKGKYSMLAILDIGEEEPLEAIEKTIGIH